MDVPQLKLLAGRVRGLLEESSSSVGHSQALDLVAALPGLRNWPEVAAFPERVAVCELDTTSAGRLAFRLKKNFALEFTPKDLLSVLVPESSGLPRAALEIWPAGPAAGVYVTTSEEAIKALLERYEEATDGGLVYAERAASGSDGTIDLGEYGLWSAGIERLPSGTLLVVGPIELDQQSWSDAAERLEMACLHALNSDHRVAVLVSTPAPEALCEDLVVLLQSGPNQPSDTESAFVGFVSESGELQCRRPFARPYPKPVAVRAERDLTALPASTRELLRFELARHTSGLVLFGSSAIVEHIAYDQIAAALTLSEQSGPAARIMARHRSTPAKDWLVPDAIKALPFLPSIESAYAQGYRRMIVSPHYLRVDALLNYEDVLFLGGTYGHTVEKIALSLLARADQHESTLFERIVAVLGLFPVAGKSDSAVACDLFVRGSLPGPSGKTFSELEAFLLENRAIRWEDELTSLLDTGAVTVGGVKKAAGKDHTMAEFLTRRRKSKGKP